MILMKIVGLTYDEVFYQIKVRGVWKQYKKSLDDFLYMMWVLFPELMRRSKRYNFDDKQQVANWLYNYGEEIKPCETYIFCNKCE